MTTKPTDIAASVTIQGLRQRTTTAEWKLEDRMDELEAAVLGLASILEEAGLYSDDPRRDET